MKKRGLSPVIAVVLLLMITIIAASLIVAFVVPFIKGNLNEGKECFEIIGDLEIANTNFNCYVSSSNKTSFSVAIKNEEIIGFLVALESEGSSDAFEIKEGTIVSGIGMLGGGELSIPGNGGTRTYVADGAFERAKISPILESGTKCDVSDSVTLSECMDGEAINSIVG